MSSKIEKCMKICGWSYLTGSTKTLPHRQIRILSGQNATFQVWDADLLRGNNGQDILIGGSTIYDSDRSALDQIMEEWNSDDSWSDRVDALQVGFDGLALLAGDQVLDDDAIDDLRGGNGRDWFFAGQTDQVRDDRANEVVEAI